MAQLTSRNSLTITLSNTAPSNSVTYQHTHAIQGPTDVTFILSGIDLGTNGIYDFQIDYGDGTPLYNIEPVFIDKLPTNLSLSTVCHTYYQTQSAAFESKAEVKVRYLADEAITVVHDITLKQSADNIIDSDFTLINTQLCTMSGILVPLFNIESNENTIYPCAFIEPVTAAEFDDGIYLVTDPEDINIDSEYLYRSGITLTSDLTAYGLSALSGSGFTVQGQSGNQYTAVFGITGDAPRYTYNHSTSTVVISSNINNFTGIADFQQTVENLFINNGLVGTEFSLISSQGDVIYFYQNNLLPPEATNYTYTTSTSATEITAGYAPYSGVDEIYSYVNNPYGDSGLLGLSAVNRIKTDPDELFIAAL